MDENAAGDPHAVEDPRVVEDPERERFEIRVGDRLAGFTSYRRQGRQADFLHTEIADEFGGRGLASTLIGSALDTARERGWTVGPYCPFVKAFIAKHPDYLDLVPAGDRARFGLTG